MRLHAEHVAACPFSAASEWVVEGLCRRGLLCRRRADLADRGRPHDEVQVCPPSPFSPPLRATVRLRIERLFTRVIIEGDDDAPDGARGILEGVLRGIVADLEARERDRRASARPWERSAAANPYEIQPALSSASFSKISSSSGCSPIA